MKKVEAGMLNNTAFRLRQRMIDEISGSMTIRDQNFLKRSILFQKATVSGMVAEVGSVMRPRFSGWSEQQTGKTKGKPRKRFGTLTARRGKKRNKISGKFRAKSSNDFIRPSNRKGLSDNSGRDVMIFLQILKRRKYKPPFFIPISYKRLQKGFYIFVRGKLKRAQGFNPQDTQRNAWMTRAVNSLSNKDMNDDFQEALRHFGLK